MTTYKMVDEQTKKAWESLAWLEIDTAMNHLAMTVPNLGNPSLDSEKINAVSTIKTGPRPFGFKWSKTSPGKCDEVWLPYYILRSPFARKQAAWLIAGFIHAAERFGRYGPKKWKKISRAAGLAGFLFPKLRQAVSINRLEPQALLIIAAAGRLEWTRLRVPGIHHWTARVRRKDIEESKWLGKTARSAAEEVKRPKPSGNRILEMSIKQAIAECERMAWHMRKTDAGKSCAGLARALEVYFRAIKSEKHPRKPAKHHSQAEEKVWEMILTGKTAQQDVMGVLGEVEEFLKKRIWIPKDI